MLRALPCARVHHTEGAQATVLAPFTNTVFLALPGLTFACALVSDFAPIHTHQAGSSADGGDLLSDPFVDNSAWDG